MIKYEQIINSRFPILGSGSYSTAYDTGEYVIKVPRQFKGDNDKHVVQYRRALALQAVRMFRTLRAFLGEIIPHTEYLSGGFLIQKKVDGLTYYDFDDTGKRKVLENAYKLRDVCYNSFPDWHFDTNSLNYKFNSNFEVTSWFDPFTPNMGYMKKILKKNPHREWQ